MREREKYFRYENGSAKSNRTLSNGFVIVNAESTGSGYIRKYLLFIQFETVSRWSDCRMQLKVFSETAKINVDSENIKYQKSCLNDRNLCLHFE